MPDHAPSLGDTVPVFVWVPAAAPVRRVFVRTMPDGEPHFTPVIGRGPETPFQFYGGDLDGIAERLHLDRLGVNTVYLTSIFPSRSNHRYDAASFDRVGGSISEPQRTILARRATP